MVTSNLFLCFWSRAHASCTMLVTLSICGFQCDKTQLSFRGDILSCCFLVNSYFIFLPSPILHCIVFHEKGEENELCPEGSITITASLPLKGRGKKRLNGIIKAFSSSVFESRELEVLSQCCNIMFFCGFVATCYIPEWYFLCE